MNKMHRINLHVDGNLYPFLDKAMKDLKPRSKAELIRKLAELALILLREKENRDNEKRPSTEESVTESSNEQIDAISKLFGDSNEEDDT